MIDIQTFLLALGIGNIAFALLIACYMHDADRSAPLRDWMWARLASGLGQCAWWAAPHVGLHLAETLAVCVWIVGVLLELSAYCRFFAICHVRRVMLGASVLAALALAAALAAGASDAQLIWSVSAQIALFASVAAVALLCAGGAQSLLQRVIGVNAGLFALAIWSWLIVKNGSVGTPATSTIHALAYLAGYLLMIVNGFGFMLMCKQKDDQQMRRLATIDGLTETLNRRAFFERADGARQLALRLRKPIALLMLDLDHFKQLNDNFGHACGDQALRLFADIAHGMLREHDLIGRLGGEEFALALPGTTLDGARQAAERLRVAVCEAPLLSCAQSYRMSISIGVVLIETNEELTAALARADHALYRAKTGGRNRVEVGTPMLMRA